MPTKDPEQRREQSRRYYVANATKIAAKAKAKRMAETQEQRDTRLAKQNAYHRAYREAHQERYRELERARYGRLTQEERRKAYTDKKASHQAWRARNRSKRNAQECDRRKHDPVFRMLFNRRTRRSILVRNGVKKTGGQTLADLGCSFSEWQRWLEGRFHGGMTWENYGKHWHLDEIIPCNAWNLEDPTHWASCWHWTNSQPLLAYENLSRSSRPEDYTAAIAERLMVLRSLDLLTSHV